MRVVLKPYPAYRVSGLAWLDEVPAHWTLTPNRALMRKRKVLVGEHHSEHQLLSLTKAGIIVRDIDSGKGKFSADMGTCQEVRCGNLVFCLFDVPETPRTVGLSPHVGMITGAYTVFECSDPALSAYLHLFYRVMDDRKLLSPLYSGLRNTIPPTRLLSIKTPVPSTDEQHAIVRYVDYVERRVRQCLREKQKLIKLLEEQKQVATHRAVTRGLDPSAPLKFSGIPWLGEIPQHWEVRRIKYLLREVDERSTTGAEPLLSMRRQHGLVLFAEHFRRPPQASTLVGFKIVRPGQFVVNRMQAGNGLIFASTLTGLVSPDYAVFDPIGDANVDFLGELFRSRKVRATFRAESKGLGTGSSGFLRLYNDRLGAIHVALPPSEEQCEIVAAISGELSGANLTIARLERENELLREYRTRIVADVVTGKLDVREAVANLPDEADELELDDGEDGCVDGAETDGIGDSEAALEGVEA